MPADGTSSQDEKFSSSRYLKQIEVNQTLTALYLIVESTRWQCGQKPGVSSFGTWHSRYAHLWPYVLNLMQINYRKSRARLFASSSSDDCKAALG